MYLTILKTALIYSYFIYYVSCQNCVDKSQTKEIPKGLKTVPVVLVLTTLGSDARLPCHYCSVRAGISGRIWRRKSLHGKERLVQLDMHDDPTKNRIFVVEDHSLVILRVTKNDGAYYFCYDVEDVYGTAKMDILLDVEHRTELEPQVIKMPRDLDKEVPKWLETCKELKNVPSLSKYDCYAEWGTWSRCDACGKIGERKRVGVCRLQKFEKVQMETPQGNVIEADFPIVGVSCHSVLLDDVPQAKQILNKIPNLVLIEKCEIPCMSFTIKSETKLEKEGARLTLFCPGAGIDTRVKWKKNEKSMIPDKLKESSAGRVYIDAMDALHVKELRVTDSGEYICTLDDVEIGLIRLKVISKYAAFDPTTHFGVLTLAMLASFFIWFVVMALKWKNFAMQRKAYQIRNRRLQEEQSATQYSESQSLLDSSEITKSSNLFSSSSMTF